MTKIMIQMKLAQHLEYLFEETCERDGASTRKISAEIYPCSSKACSEGFSFFITIP
jgi:hypothetical protein